MTRGTTEVPVDRELVGSIGLAELATICEQQGLEYLPYPFMETVRSSPGEQVDRRRGTSQLCSGDADVFQEWMQSYTRADIWVECRVIHRFDETRDTRVLAFRVGDAGYLACQRPDEDTVDGYRLSAYELGSAIAESVGLTQPGSREGIVIPKYVDYFIDSFDDLDDEFQASILDPASSATARRVRDGDVTAVATVQSHCAPARSWGVDWDKKFAAFVCIEDDGDYIYDAGFLQAVPLSEPKLARRIDTLIAGDVIMLRELRGMG